MATRIPPERTGGKSEVQSRWRDQGTSTEAPEMSLLQKTGSEHGLWGMLIFEEIFARGSRDRFSWCGVVQLRLVAKACQERGVAPLGQGARQPVPKNESSVTCGSSWGWSRRGFSWQAKENREETKEDDGTELSLLKSPTAAERSSE